MSDDHQRQIADQLDTLAEVLRHHAELLRHPPQVLRDAHDPARLLAAKEWPRDEFGVHACAPSKCTCWVGRGDMGGDAAERATCAVHGSENVAGSTHEEWQRDSHS